MPIDDTDYEAMVETGQVPMKEHTSIVDFWIELGNTRAKHSWNNGLLTGIFWMLMIEAILVVCGTGIWWALR